MKMGKLDDIAAIEAYNARTNIKTNLHQRNASAQAWIVIYTVLGIAVVVVLSALNRIVFKFQDVFVFFNNAIDASNKLAKTYKGDTYLVQALQQCCADVKATASVSAFSMVMQLGWRSAAGFLPLTSSSKHTPSFCYTLMLGNRIRTRSMLCGPILSPDSVFQNDLFNKIEKCFNNAKGQSGLFFRQSWSGGMVNVDGTSPSTPIWPQDDSELSTAEQFEQALRIRNPLYHLYTEGDAVFNPAAKWPPGSSQLQGSWQDILDEGIWNFVDKTTFTDDNVLAAFFTADIATKDPNCKDGWAIMSGVAGIGGGLSMAMAPAFPPFGAIAGALIGVTVSLGSDISSNVQLGC